MNKIWRSFASRCQLEQQRAVGSMAGSGFFEIEEISVVIHSGA